MLTHEERSDNAKKAWETRRARKTAPEVTVSPRDLAPQEAMYHGELEEAQKLIDARLNRSVFEHTSGAIAFTDPQFVGRWFNVAVSSQRLYEAQQSGWVPVPPAMISDLNRLGVYAVNDAGYVVRGQRGEEHLYFMTKVNQQRIAEAKTTENDARLGSGKKSRQDLIESVAAQGHSEAAEFLSSKVIGDVVDGVEQIGPPVDTE